jgi:hypothetical protein
MRWVAVVVGRLLTIAMKRCMEKEDEVKDAG